MIKSLTIQNFKSHKNSCIDFANLTVLSGTNGVGKSSAIHPLLLLREAYLSNSNFEYLDLQSKSVTIGTAKDALYQFSETNNITFEVLTDQQRLPFSFHTTDADLVKTLMYKTIGTNHVSEKEKLEVESLFNKNFQFISAARLGPKRSYEKNDVVVGVHNQISVVEGQAEHFVHYLMLNSNKDVLPSLLNDNLDLNDLFSQTMAWEGEISRGINIVIRDVGALGYELKYQYNTESKSGKTNEFSASNVGFGISYVMPIIVAILSADPNTLLLIENPEAHLHPRGQSKLAELLCLAAQAGIQIVIETHSDHIINGILVQCKKYEDSKKGILQDNVCIYHFDRNEADHCTKLQKVKIEEGGRVRYTPTGFFDQFTIDRKFLMGI